MWLLSRTRARRIWRSARRAFPQGPFGPRGPPWESAPRPRGGSSWPALLLSGCIFLELPAVVDARIVTENCSGLQQEKYEAVSSKRTWREQIWPLTLINGKATVTIDPIFVDCIADSKPFKVFVQGGENTLGSIRITRNQKNKTFIVEDLGGNSNGIVQYSVYGIWKQKENLRFPEYKQPLEFQSTKATIVESTDIKIKK